MKLILTGTSGNLGSKVLKALLDLKLIPPTDLVVSSSSPAKVPQIAKDYSIPVLQADFRDEASCERMFKEAKADTLFLVSYPSPSIERWHHHKTVIDAAKASGAIKLIVYTSLMFGGKTGLESIAGVQQAHIKTAHYLKDCKLDYVVIREGIYAESWWLYAGFQDHPIPSDAPAEIEWVISNDGRVAWVSWDDLGEGTARILARIHDGSTNYVGRTLNLTGPRATAISECAKLAEKYSGRRINVRIVDRDEAIRYHLEEKKSLPPEQAWQVESWSGWHDALQAGEAAFVDPLLAELLKRQPRGMEEKAEELFTPVSGGTEADDELRAS